MCRLVVEEDLELESRVGFYGDVGEVRLLHPEVVPREGQVPHDLDATTGVLSVNGDGNPLRDTVNGEVADSGDKGWPPVVTAGGITMSEVVTKPAVGYRSVSMAIVRIGRHGDLRRS